MGLEREVGSSWWDPRGEIHVVGSSWWDPRGWILGVGSTWWDPRGGIHVVGSSGWDCLREREAAPDAILSRSDLLSPIADIGHLPRMGSSISGSSIVGSSIVGVGIVGFGIVGSCSSVFRSRTTKSDPALKGLLHLGFDPSSRIPHLESLISDPSSRIPHLGSLISDPR